MDTHIRIKKIINRYPDIVSDIKKYNIDTTNLEEIYKDYIDSKHAYESQAEFIANILRGNANIHSVKSRIKDSDRLIEKVVRKTPDRKAKYGDDFEFTVNNYKEEINDLIGVRVIHIFKSEWEKIHKFINEAWKVIEITANVRDGDDTRVFDELGIEVRSRQSGYRSVHYLVELNFTKNSSIIAEIQVRTIFEEGYGEIDHRLRYSHHSIPEVLKDNILLFNRIIGSADEMASLINRLSDELLDKDKYYEKILKEKDEEIFRLKNEILKKD